MSITVQGPLDTEYKRLTDNTLTTIFTATSRTGIVFMSVKENNGGTPNITLYRDGDVDHYFKNAEAVTAKQRITFDEVFYLKSGDTLKAQSSDASGHFDIYVTYLMPNKAFGG